MLKTTTGYLTLLACVVFANPVGIAFGQACSAPNYDSPEYIVWLKKLDFHKYWYANNFPKEARAPQQYVAAMKIRIAPNGFITHLSVRDSSSTPYGDFSCLESLYNVAPFEPMPLNRHSYPMQAPGSSAENDFEPDRYQNVISFGGKDLQPKPFPEAEAFETKHPSLKNRCYLLHLIPLGINDHYPGMFSENELLSANNLVALKANIEPEEALEPFLTDWQSFISKHKSATKAEIIAQSNKIKADHLPLFVVYAKLEK